MDPGGQRLPASAARHDLERRPRRLPLAERRSIVARMASGIAHDVNNVLTGILGAVGQSRFVETAEDIERDGTSARRESASAPPR